MRNIFDFVRSIFATSYDQKPHNFRTKVQLSGSAKKESISFWLCKKVDELFTINKRLQLSIGDMNPEEHVMSKII